MEYIPEKPNPIYDLLKQGKRVISIDIGWDESDERYEVDGEEQGSDFMKAVDDSDDLRVIGVDRDRTIQPERWFDLDYKLVDGNALDYRIVDRRIDYLKGALFHVRWLKDSPVFIAVADQCIELLTPYLEVQQAELAIIKAQLTPEEIKLLEIES